MMETVTDRITRYLLGRLRRRAVLDLYENAAYVGLLEGYPATEDEESGTVWTVADNTRHRLTGDKEKDRKLIGRRLRKSMASSSGMAPYMFDYETDQDALPDVKPRTKSRVKHIAASASTAADQEAPAANLMPGRSTKVRTDDVMAMVLEHVRAPNVPHVTVALLLARAVGTSITDIAALRRLMSRPDLFALIKAPVPGFERRFTQLLEDGLLLPYRVNIGDVYHGATLREHHHGDSRKKSRRLVKLLSGNRARHIEHTVLSKHLGDALLDSTSPVIVVDEASVAPAMSLALTADVVFECAGLDNALLAELLHITLGFAPALSLKRMEAAPLDLEGLSIDDLTLAIRPSHDLDTILATLAAFGDRAREHDDAGEGKDSDDRRGRTIGAHKSKNSKVSSSPDGAEIIHPVKPAVEKMGADKGEAAPAGSYSQSLRIETLSGYGDARQWALDLQVDLELWREAV